MSELSVWWVRLGIKIERIRPGHPEENGQHERMHRTLKAETTNPSGHNILEQQEIFDNFLDIFNNERPHQGIDNKRPVDLYKFSDKKIGMKLPHLEYPKSDISSYVGKNGCINFQKKNRIFLSKAFNGEYVGITMVDEKVWKVTFMDKVLGFIDDESNRFSITENPFI